MKTFNIELTESEIDAIVNALADKPYREVMQLIPKIVQQVKKSEESPTAVAEVSEK